MYRTSLGWAALGLAVAGCAATPAPPGQEISADDFKTSVVGKMTKWESADMQIATTAFSSYKPDGTISGTYTQPGKSGTYNGTWIMQGNKVCVTDSRANGGLSACRTWRRVGDASFAEVNPDGSLHGTTTILK